MFGDWALPRPMWELTALPQIPWLYLRGLLCSREGQRREKRGKRERGGITPVTNSWIHHC